MVPRGEDLRITGRELSQLTGMNSRLVHAEVSTLRTKGVPICADRGNNGGYYIPTTKAGLKHGIGSLRSEALQSMKIVSRLNHIDLNQWNREMNYE